MRLVLKIGLIAWLGAAAGCSNFKWGGNWAPTGPVAKASGVNIYNCSDEHQIEVFRRVAGNGNQWTYIYATGSTSDESTCPDEGDLPIFVDLPDGERYQIRINYYTTSDNCEGNEPEGGGVDGGPSCPFRDITYDGDSNAADAEYLFTYN